MKRYNIRIKSIGIAYPELIQVCDASRISIALKRAIDNYQKGKSKINLERAGLEIKAFLIQ